MKKHTLSPHKRTPKRKKEMDPEHKHACMAGGEEGREDRGARAPRGAPASSPMTPLCPPPAHQRTFF